MTTTGEFLKIAATALGIFALLSGVIGTWAVMRHSLQQISTQISELKTTVAGSAKETRAELSALTERVTRLETRADATTDRIDAHSRGLEAVQGEVRATREAVTRALAILEHQPSRRRRSGGDDG